MKAYTDHEKEVFVATLAALAEVMPKGAEWPFTEEDSNRLNIAFLMWKEGRHQMMDLFNELADGEDDVDTLKRVFNKYSYLGERPATEAL